MPTYDYRCRKCGHVFEVFHSMSDDTPRRCPECRSKAVKVPGLGAGILFKGSGFYITDYRSDSYQQKARQESPSGPADAPPGGGASKAETPRVPKAGSKTASKKRGSAP